MLWKTFSKIFPFFPKFAVAAENVSPNHDEFYWLGQINKASLVINTDEGLLCKTLAPKFAKGIATVLEEGEKPGAPRPKTVIAFEPLLIKAAGQEITLLHAGRSSQDMHATYRVALMRTEMLSLAESLNAVTAKLLHLGGVHSQTIVPSYTNGVAAQPTSYGHYLLAFAAGFERDMQRLRQYYARLDRSPMGTTVLNGSSWPLNRERMAEYLGFGAVADNAYDASQVYTTENATEAGYVVSSIMLHIGNFIEDIMQQYAQPRPWILLQEGGDNTYVSSAMPQKRNPGILNSTRSKASTVIGDSVGTLFRAHNVPPGMPDARDAEVYAMVRNATAVTRNFLRILGALNVNPERSLEELNLDWTASQEVADVLMRDHGVAFRVGHHFASEMVSYARANAITPLHFPYAEAGRIYKEAVAGYEGPAELPMDEAAFRKALDPVAIVNNRATRGGPQPAEMTRMLHEAKEKLAADSAWVAGCYATLTAAEEKLEKDFGAVLKS